MKAPDPVVVCGCERHAEFSPCVVGRAPAPRRERETVDSQQRLMAQHARSADDPDAGVGKLCGWTSNPLPRQLAPGWWSWARQSCFHQQFQGDFLQCQQTRAVANPIGYA